MSTQALEVGPPKGNGQSRTAWRLLMNNRLAAAAFYIVVLIVILALMAPILPLHDPNMTSPADRLLPLFSDGHLLGTDHLGRDVLARLVWGTRVSLFVGVSAALAAAFFGSLIGLVAGYAGGRADNLIMRTSIC